MYIPPAFRLEDRDAILAVMRENAFAVLIAHAGMASRSPTCR